jgi:hypothetical protein
VFRYCKAGGTLVPGKMVQSPAGSTNHKNLAVAAAVDVGATTLTVTAGTGGVTANQFKDGHLAIYDGTNVGMTYRIKSNTAASAGSSTTIVLYDEIAEALTTDDKVALVACRYNGVIVAPATKAGDLVGVPIVDVTSGYYFWAQVSGVCAVLADGAWTIGTPLVRSGSVAGALTVQLAGTNSLAAEEVAVALSDAADTKYGLCQLRLS